MTNNQRFMAELVVLITIGVVVLAKAGPKQQDKPAQDEIHAKRVVIDGANGKRAVLGEDESGDVSLTFYNGAGKKSLELGVTGESEDIVGVKIFDTHGIRRPETPEEKKERMLEQEAHKRQYGTVEAGEETPFIFC